MFHEKLSYIAVQRGASEGMEFLSAWRSRQGPGLARTRLLEVTVAQGSLFCLLQYHFLYVQQYENGGS